MAKSVFIKPGDYINQNLPKIMQGLQDAGEEVLTEAIDLAPLKEGTLRRSATLVVDMIKKRVIVSFNTIYAWYQHENILNHPIAGTDHYLEIPFVKQGVARVLQLIQRRMKG